MEGSSFQNCKCDVCSYNAKYNHINNLPQLCLGLRPTSEHEFQLDDFRIVSSVYLPYIIVNEDLYDSIAWTDLPVPDSQILSFLDGSVPENQRRCLVEIKLDGLNKITLGEVHTYDDCKINMVGLTALNPHYTFIISSFSEISCAHLHCPCKIQDDK